MPDSVKSLDGKKFFWDGAVYDTDAATREKAAAYAGKGFETRVILEDGKSLVYTRREAAAESQP